MRALKITALAGITLCIILRIATFCEEMNIRQIERETAELQKVEAIERVNYFKLLNEVYGGKQ